MVETTLCDLGSMHGRASTYTDADGVVCCDFCGQPVFGPAATVVDQPTPTPEQWAMDMAYQLADNFGMMEPCEIAADAAAHVIETAFAEREAAKDAEIAGFARALESGE